MSRKEQLIQWLSPAARMVARVDQQNRLRFSGDLGTVVQWLPREAGLRKECLGIVGPRGGLVVVPGAEVSKTLGTLGRLEGRTLSLTDAGSPVVD